MDIVVGKEYVRVKEYPTVSSNRTFKGQKVVVRAVRRNAVYFTKYHRDGTGMVTHAELKDFLTYFRPKKKMEENE